MVEAGRLVAEARQRATTLAVLWLDLDRFQSINRAFGHAGGDQVIDQVARRIEAHRTRHRVVPRRRRRVRAADARHHARPGGTHRRGIDDGGATAARTRCGTAAPGTDDWHCDSRT
ncbi:MAG: diguanylate cyclase [Gammaproteobacteria bacterium]|nr:diguanylate cyclase [Gammaproteobacteria bacterium]